MLLHILQRNYDFLQVIYGFFAEDVIVIILVKKKRILWERTKEHHDHNKDSVIYNHIANSKGVSYLVDLLNTNNNSAAHEKFDRKAFNVNIVKGNTCIIDKARQCDILLFKEALKIEEKCP